MARGSPKESYDLSATKLVKAMRAAIEAVLVWPPKASHTPVLHFGRGEDHVMVAPEGLWGKFGQRVTLPATHGANGIHVIVPTFGAVLRYVAKLYVPAGVCDYTRVTGVLIEHSNPDDRPFRTNREELELRRAPPPLADYIAWEMRELGRQDPAARADRTLREWARIFDRLAPDDQESVTGQLRNAAAIGVLAFNMASFVAELFPLSVRIEPRLAGRRREAEQQRLEEAGDPASNLVPLYAWCRGLLDAFFWEQPVLPSERVERLLPTGGRLKERPEPTATPLRLTARAVGRDDPRVDAARFDFYARELGCRSAVEPEGWFGDHNYVAFLLKGRSGARFVLLDCKDADGLVYLIRDARPDAGDESASKPGSTQADDKPFVRRFHRTAEWQARLRRFLDDQ